MLNDASSARKPCLPANWAVEPLVDGTSGLGGSIQPVRENSIEVPLSMAESSVVVATII
jgi:hypothetical protein